VKKSNGKLYWYGPAGEVLQETTLTNTLLDDYIFFNGNRTARRRKSDGAVFYFLSDHLGSARVVTNVSGVIVEESDYYPYGGERIIVNALDNNYKFTGQERDTESGLDYFIARHYSSNLGRFLQPDRVNVTWRRLLQPGNTLNKYAYAANNPLLYVDPNGEDITVFYRRAIGASPGHILIAATNQSTGKVMFFDYYPKKSLPIAQVTIDKVVNSERLMKHAAITIRTTPEAAQRVIEAIESFKEGELYNVATNNCVTSCLDLLRLAGIELDPLGPNTPDAIWAQLYGSYSAEAIRQGGTTFGVVRYQPGVDFGVPMSVLPDDTDPFFNLQILYLISKYMHENSEKAPRGQVCVTLEGGEPKCTDVE